MKVLMVASEITPIAKVGGLGDVVGALPKALEQLGVEVGIVTGYYGIHQEKDYPTKEIKRTFLSWGGQEIEYSVRQGILPGSDVKIYYIDEPKIIGSGGVYSSPTAFASGQEESERFLFIAKAAARLPEQIGFQPELWHLHDWHAAPVTVFLPTDHASTLLTIHNLANQGWASSATAAKAELDDKTNEGINLFGLGLRRADWLSTVSPSYAKEIQGKPEGEGFEDLLAERNSRLVGITNGIDTSFFNPASDRFLTEHLKEDVITFKKRNCDVLSGEMKLEENSTPLIGIISRLTYQKGIELVVEAIEPYLKKQQVQFVCLGTGDPVLEKSISNLVERYPGQAACKLGFDERLAHMIYASSDFFLMPSRFEPCGLGQLIAMRYGTVPIVRATGGLKDTVVDIDKPGGNGIVFSDFKASALTESLERALKLYGSRAKLGTVRQQAQARDSSWLASAREYLKLYQLLCRQ